MFVDSPWPFTSTINHILTKKTEFQFFRLKPGYFLPYMVPWQQNSQSYSADDTISSKGIFPSYI